MLDIMSKCAACLAHTAFTVGNDLVRESRFDRVLLRWNAKPWPLLSMSALTIGPSILSLEFYIPAIMSWAFSAEIMTWFCPFSNHGFSRNFIRFGTVMVKNHSRGSRLVDAAVTLCASCRGSVVDRLQYLYTRCFQRLASWTAQAA